MNVCSRPNCNDPEHAYGICKKHYRKACNAGMFNVLVDPTEAIARIQNLRDNRWTFQQIADAAGVECSSIADLFSGRHTRCRKRTRDAILSVPPIAGVAVTHVGLKRRVEALAWMGWSQPSVAKEMGYAYKTMRNAIDSGEFGSRFGQALAETYRRLSSIEGPDEECRFRARNVRRVAPPIAWDDDTIDTAPDLRAGIIRNRHITRGPRRTHCRKNHEQTPENFMITSNGRSRCRVCYNEGMKAYRKRVRERKSA